METVLALFAAYKYPALVALSVVEGPYIMMVSGFLVHLGVFAFVPAFIALSIGDAIGDILWYYVGYHFGDRFVGRFGKYVDVTPTHIESVKRVFSNHKKKIIIGSKMTMGLGFSLATLVVAGMTRMPLGQFLFLNLLGQVVWTGILMAVGYYFGHFYTAVNDGLGKMSVIAGGIVCLFLIVRLVKYIGRRAQGTLN